MALTTRCPNCRTAFKVVADQLRVRNGLVRCGACGTVFDGRACLEGEGPAPAALAPAPRPDPQPIPAFLANSQAASRVNDAPELAPARLAAPVVPIAPVVPAASATFAGPPPATVPPAVLRGRDRLVSEPAPEQAPGPEPDDIHEDDASEPDGVYAAGEYTLPAIRATEPGLAADGGHEAHVSIRAYDPEDYPPEHGEPEFTVGSLQKDAADDEAAGERVYGDVRTRYSSATDVGRAPPEFLDQDRIKSHRAMRRVWGWLCLVGLLALAGQLLYVYRTPIAIAVPSLRPEFTGMCAVIGCRVSYARRIERIFIESSSLRPPQQADLQNAVPAAADGPSRLILAAVLRNRYDKPQEWPALVLSLTDMSDTVIARKIIRPVDYLPPGTTGPMAPGAEVTISVPIVVTGLKVNGYQIDKFFP